MSLRLTYVPTDLVDLVPSFIASRAEEVSGSVRVHTHNCSVLSLVKTLHALRSGPLSYTDFFRRSEIRFKRSFHGYLSICMDYGFVTKTRSGGPGAYAITDRGMAALDLFVQKSN